MAKITELWQQPDPSDAEWSAALPELGNPLGRYGTRVCAVRTALLRQPSKPRVRYIKNVREQFHPVVLICGVFQE